MGSEIYQSSLYCDLPKISTSDSCLNLNKYHIVQSIRQLDIYPVDGFSFNEKAFGRAVETCGVLENAHF